MTAPISATLLETVGSYAEWLRSNETVTPARRSQILSFAEAVFEQFFRAEFSHQITGFWAGNKREAVRLRTEHDKPKEVTQIVALFEQFCDAYVDLTGAGYGGGSQAALRDLHRKLVPRLLARLGSWLAQSGEPELANTASVSRERYMEAIKGRRKW